MRRPQEARQAHGEERESPLLSGYAGRKESLRKSRYRGFEYFEDGERNRCSFRLFSLEGLETQTSASDVSPKGVARYPGKLVAAGEGRRNVVEMLALVVAGRRGGRSCCRTGLDWQRGASSIVLKGMTTWKLPATTLVRASVVVEEALVLGPAGLVMVIELPLYHGIYRRKLDERIRGSACRIRDLFLLRSQSG